MEEPQSEERSGWERARPVLLTTLVPVAAAAGFFLLAVYGKTSADPRAQPSMAAFDACLTEHGLQSSGAYPTQFDQTVAAQQQMEACGDRIPKKVLEDAATEQRRATASYRQCLKNLGGGFSRGFGRFRDPPSSNVREAFATCRALLADGGGARTTPVRNTPEPPVA